MATLHTTLDVGSERLPISLDYDYIRASARQEEALTLNRACICGHDFLEALDAYYVEQLEGKAWEQARFENHVYGRAVA